MPASPNARTGVVVPIGSDPDQVPADLKTISDRIAAVAALWRQGSYSSRPTAAASSFGTLHYAEDRGILSIDTGGQYTEFMGKVPTVGALPASPFQDQEVIVKPDPTNQPNVRWHVRYDSAVSGWVFLGGPPIMSYNSSGVGGSTSTFAGFAQGQLTVPFSGDYDVTGSAIVSSSGRAILTLVKPGSAASDARRVVDASSNATGGRTFRDTGLTAGQTYQFAHRLVSGSSVTSSDFRIALTPTRLTA